MPLLEQFYQKITCLILLTAALAAGMQVHAEQTTEGAADLASQVKQARAKVASDANDPKNHYALAELLKKEGRQKEAAEEYLATTALEPDYYLAYHQMLTVNADPSQLDEAISRLTNLEDERPKDLMLRVALSEVLEKQGNYYRAARCLVDMLYGGLVPDRYRTKIDTRIHFLLSKAQRTESDEKSPVIEDDQDALPPALPDSLRPANLSATKQGDVPSVQEGHTPLLP